MNLIFNKNKMPYKSEIRDIRRIHQTVKEMSQEEMIEMQMRLRDGIKDGKKERFDKRNIRKTRERKKHIFALGIETISRTLGMDLFDVQIAGALGITDRNIVEMKTGEGKTVTAVLACLWGHIEGLQTYVITVNEYLSARDYSIAKEVFDYLDMEIGHVNRNMKKEIKKDNYEKPVVYLTNSEFAFDHLRDNVALKAEDVMQGDYDFMIIDEADLILIDEARNPIILASKEIDNSYYFKRAKEFMRFMEDEDYEMADNLMTATLTESGFEKSKDFFRCELIENRHLYNAVCQSVIAHFVFRKDIDYMIREDEVMIIDKFTGRVLPGRRFQNGLHQALEAKENVPIKTENISIGTTTYQNLFKKFIILSGMTGTASQARKEFTDIYKTGVLPIPTNRPMIRKDYEDMMFRTKQDKYDYLLSLVKERHNLGQPILIGTTSVMESEDISRLFRQEGIPFQLLNAKNDREEEELVLRAGERGMVTISTNMAGRGTDIKLSDEVEALGGLYVIGTSRNESKRIDLQLRGRSGRQGQRGESIFLLSIEDDLMEKDADSLIDSYRKKIKDIYPQNDKKTTKAVDSVQKSIESFMERSRAQNYKTDQIINAHRDFFTRIRRELLLGERDLSFVLEYVPEIIRKEVTPFVEHGHIYGEKLSELVKFFRIKYHISLDLLDENSDYSVKELCLKLNSDISERFQKEVIDYGKVMLVDIKRNHALSIFNETWSIYLAEMDYKKNSYAISMMGVQGPEHVFTIEADEIFTEIFTDMCTELLHELLPKKEQEEFKDMQVISIMDFSIDDIPFNGFEDYMDEQSLNMVISLNEVVIFDDIIETRKNIYEEIMNHLDDDGVYKVEFLSRNTELFTFGFTKIDSDMFLTP